MSSKQFATPEEALQWVRDLIGPVEIARVCGVSYQATQQWTRVPTRQKAEALSKRFGGRVSVDELWSGK